MVETFNGAARQVVNAVSLSVSEQNVVYAGGWYLISKNRTINGFRTMFFMIGLNRRQTHWLRLLPVPFA